MAETKLKRFLTFDEFKEQVATWSKDTLRRRIRDEGFPAIRDGNSYMIDTVEMELWFKRRKVKTRAS